MAEVINNESHQDAFRPDVTVSQTSTFGKWFDAQTQTGRYYDSNTVIDLSMFQSILKNTLNISDNVILSTFPSNTPLNTCPNVGTVKTIINELKNKNEIKTDFDNIFLMQNTEYFNDSAISYKLLDYQNTKIGFVKKQEDIDEKTNYFQTINITLPTIKIPGENTTEYKNFQSNTLSISILLCSKNEDGTYDEVETYYINGYTEDKDVWYCLNRHTESENWTISPVFNTNSPLILTHTGETGNNPAITLTTTSKKIDAVQMLVEFNTEGLKANFEVKKGNEFEYSYSTSFDNSPVKTGDDTKKIYVFGDDATAYYNASYSAQTIDVKIDYQVNEHEKTTVNKLYIWIFREFVNSPTNEYFQELSVGTNLKEGFNTLTGSRVNKDGIWFKYQTVLENVPNFTPFDVVIKSFVGQGDGDENTNLQFNQIISSTEYNAFMKDLPIEDKSILSDLTTEDASVSEQYAILVLKDKFNEYGTIYKEPTVYQYKLTIENPYTTDKTFYPGVELINGWEYEEHNLFSGLAFYCSDAAYNLSMFNGKDFSSNNNFIEYTLPATSITFYDITSTTERTLTYPEIKGTMSGVKNKVTEAIVEWSSAITVTMDFEIHIGDQYSGSAVSIYMTLSDDNGNVLKEKYSILENHKITNTIIYSQVSIDEIEKSTVYHLNYEIEGITPQTTQTTINTIRKDTYGPIYYPAKIYIDADDAN